MQDFTRSLTDDERKLVLAVIDHDNRWEAHEALRRRLQEELWAIRKELFTLQAEMGPYRSVPERPVAFPAAPNPGMHCVVMGQFINCW